MNVNHLKLTLTLSALTACSTLHAAVIVETAVRAYDPAGGAGGAVNANVSGAALSSNAITDVAGFKTAVGTAFDAGQGGVLNFEETTAAYSGISGSYASGAKTLVIGTSDTFNLQTFSGASAISGDHAMIMPASDLSAGDDFTLTLTPPAGEIVTNVGFTLLSRSGTPAYPETISVTAFFSNGTSSLLSANLTANTTGNTFFGFAALPGLSITSIFIDTPLPTPTTSDERAIMDDFGFITAPAPEPGVGIMTLGGLGILGSRRRRLKAA